MDHYELSKNDYEIVAALYSFENSLFILFDEISLLEQEGKLDSKEGRIKVNYLKNQLEEEKKIFEKLGNSTLKLSAIKSVLVTSFKNDNLADDLQLIRNGSDDELIKRRIILKINNIILKNKRNNVISCYIDDEKYDEKNINTVEMQVEYDFIRTFLFLLSPSIVSKSDYKIRSKAIQIKNRCAFLYSEIAKELLENNFQVSDNLFWGGTLFSKYYKIPDSVVKEKHESVSRELLNSIIDELKNTNENEISDETNFQILTIILRTAILFNFGSDIDYFRDSVEQLKTKTINSNLIPSLEAFLLSLEFYEGDKLFPKIVDSNIRSRKK